MIKNLMCLIFILGICYFFQTQFEYAYLIEIGLILILTYFYVDSINKEKKSIKKVFECFKELYEGVEGFEKSEKNKEKLLKIYKNIKEKI
jgi:hypothetical protein